MNSKESKQDIIILSLLKKYQSDFVTTLQNVKEDEADEEIHLLYGYEPTDRNIYKPIQNIVDKIIFEAKEKSIEMGKMATNPNFKDMYVKAYGNIYYDSNVLQEQLSKNIKELEEFCRLSESIENKDKSKDIKQIEVKN